MDARNLVFQKLKPPCVRLNQAALRFAAKPDIAKDVIDALDEVHRVLNAVTPLQDALDEKLAEYVFFPLSHVLRESQKLPVRALEICLECLSLLLRTGWRNRLTPSLGTQLLILLGFMVGGSTARSKPRTSSDELQAAAFTCLSDLFLSLTNNVEGRTSLTETANIPALGHAVIVMLEGVTDGASSDVQLAALTALHSFHKCVTDQEALKNFFPGIVSSLSKVLTPSTKSRRSYRVYESGLNLLSEVLQSALQDNRLKQVIKATEVLSGHTARETTQADKSWLQATAAQVKLALANVVRLNSHGRIEVRQALFRLCSTVLEHCRESLSESASMMIETLIALSMEDSNNDSIEGQIKRILKVASGLSDLLLSSLHSWVVSLPRIMQSNDDAAKRRAIYRISLAYRLLSDLGRCSSVVDRLLASNLRDSVSNALHESLRVIGSDASISLSLPTTMDTTRLEQSSISFALVFSGNSSHRATFTALESLVERISSSDTSFTIAKESLDLVFGSQGDTRLAGFWLSFKLIEAICNQGMAMEGIIDYGNSGSDLRDSLVEELYSFSLSLLAEDELDVETDWRLQALALETVALQARRQKLDFRVDLVDALYLVIQLLGSPVQQLREHAMTCLNVLTTACGYRSTRDLIIANVDYLVNAVALRLSSFEISPQAPRVLYMMVKLSGPSLLPYLDDIVDSIFAALENFHGYSKLVELLFTVLTGIVEEGTKTQQLAIADGNPSTHRKPATKPVTMTEVAHLVAENRRKAARDVPDSSIEDPIAGSSFPMRPWKKTHNDSDPSFPEKDITQEADTDSEVQDEPDSPDPPPPAEKTYKTLLTITQLTQHYLSSASPTLRTSLLSLLNTSIPTLALHENSFLPLINTLWSVLVSRLDEPEAYVMASTLDIVGLLCVHAGDFMKGRIDSIWGDVRNMYISLSKKTTVLERSIPKSVQPDQAPKISGTVTKAILPASSSPPDPYIDAPTRLIRDTLIRFMCTLVEYVAIDDEIFDDIVAMLAPYLIQRPQIRVTLERRNPDAVWLAVKETEAATASKTGGSREVCRERPRCPVGQSWKFAELIF
ncbi:hypothetical protein LTR04_004843 [Oleoguttula sp. CCFEE 6159]|nr:hypothetical protein LTR04_004843 [Oleoguttula sp. CCFEE 6159]